MNVPLTAFVVDLGSLTVRCGYSGDDAPRQSHASCLGVSCDSSSSFPSSCSSFVNGGCSASSGSPFFSSSSSISSTSLLPDEETGSLLFPLTFSDKRKQLAVQSCLYPTFSASSSSSSSKAAQPTYILHEEVFEHVLSCCVEGPLCPLSPAAADVHDEEEDEEEEENRCPVHSYSSGSAASSSSSFVSSNGTTSHPRRSLLNCSSSSSFSAFSSPQAAAPPHINGAAAGATVAGNTAAPAAAKSCNCLSPAFSPSSPLWEKRKSEKKQRGRRWKNTELCGLGESLRECPLLLTEPNPHCRELREKMAEICFEQLFSPAVYIAPRAQLSCLSLGRSSGMVIDIGAAVTSVAPVVDGFVLHREVGEWPVAGNLLDQILACALLRHRLPLLPLFAAHKKYAGRAAFSPPSSSSSAAAAAVVSGASKLSREGSSSSKSRSSISSTYLDWSGVHSSYLQRSQCAALRAMKEGFFRVALPGSPSPLTAAGDASPRTAAARAAGKDVGGGEGRDAGQHSTGLGSEHCSVNPLCFPPSSSSTDATATAGGAVQQQQQQQRVLPSRSYITVLPPPPALTQRSASHHLHAAAARERNESAAGGMASSPDNRPLELPDGTLLAANELATAIPEVLFRPQEMLQQLQQEETWLQQAHAVRCFKGVGAALREVAARVESQEARREIFNGIVLTGGCSAMPGLFDRLNAELQRDSTFTLHHRWRLLAAPASFERSFSSWIGGSMLSSMAAFQSMWCSKEEYAEHGPSIVERKCY